MVKTKLDKKDIITSLQNLEENDPSLFRAIADYLGYGLTKETYQKKFD